SEAAGPAATMLITPGGKPTSRISSPMAKIASGLGSGTLITTVQPAATAGATFWAVPANAKLYATSVATTPTGSLTTRLWVWYGMIVPPSDPPASGPRSA